ncbi:DNA ligase, partial [Streptomyces mirabilis]
QGDAEGPQVLHLPHSTISRSCPTTNSLSCSGHNTWYNTLHHEHGVEGILAKRATSPYRAGRTGGWQKIRHAETVDADVIGYTGPQTRPRALAVRLPNGRTALTQTLSAPLAAQIAQVLVTARPAEQGRADTGEPYTRIPSGLAVVEVLAGTTRHAVVTPLRLR